MEKQGAHELVYSFGAQAASSESVGDTHAYAQSVYLQSIFHAYLYVNICTTCVHVVFRLC